MRTSAASCVALLASALFLASPAIRAQTDQGSSRLRTVHGSVLDKADNPVPGIVYLRNKKTNSVQTHIASSDGHYQFTGLDPNVDFEIHAEYKHHKSGKRTISSFDDRRDIEINLVIPKS